MQTVATTLIIGAVDKASKVLSVVGKSVGKVESKISTMAEGMGRAGLDLQDFLSQLLGPELGEFSGGLGGAAGQLKEFNKANVEGAKGLTGMKVGLVAVTGVLAFKLGNAIGNAIFQTEKWKKSLASATDEMKRLEAEGLKRLATSFDDTKERIGLLIDPEDQKAAFAELQRSIETNLDGIRKQVDIRKAKIAESDESWLYQTANYKAIVEDERQAVAAAEDRLAVLTAQRDELKKQNTVATQTLEAARAAKAAHEASVAAAEKERADRAQAAAEQQSQDAAHVEALADQLRILKLGKEAAQRYKDIQSGVSQQAIAQGDALRKQIQFMEEKKRIEEETAKQVEAAIKRRRIEQRDYISDQINEIREMIGFSSAGRAESSLRTDSRFGLVSERRDQKRDRQEQVAQQKETNKLLARIETLEKKKQAVIVNQLGG